MYICIYTGVYYILCVCLFVSSQKWGPLFGSLMLRAPQELAKILVKAGKAGMWIPLAAHTGTMSSRGRGR